jgi:hypothetical protein
MSIINLFFTIFKTRNNLKGQLGFNTNHQLANTPQKSNIVGPKLQTKNSFNHENEQEADENKNEETPFSAYRRHR